MFFPLLVISALWGTAKGITWCGRANSFISLVNLINDDNPSEVTNVASAKALCSKYNDCVGFDYISCGNNCGVCYLKYHTNVYTYTAGFEEVEENDDTEWATYINDRSYTCPPPEDIDCEGSWSECTIECETAGERVFTTITEVSGAGAECPVADDCQHGDGECLARFSDAFEAVDVDGDGVLHYNDYAKALDVLSAWSNEFHAHETGEVSFMNIHTLADTYDVAQDTLRDEILGLDKNNDGMIGDTDIAFVAQEISDQESALEELASKVAESQELLGQAEISTGDVETFFSNLKADYRSYLETLYAQMGGTADSSVTLEDFETFYDNLMVYMAVMSQVNDPDFEMTKEEFLKFHEDLNIVVEADNEELVEETRRNAEPIVSDIEIEL